MKPILSQTASGQIQDLKSIIREIVLISDPEKIFLMSASFECVLTESIYLKSTIQEETGRYYNLLLLSNAEQNKSQVNNEVALHNRFRDRNLQFQVMDIHKFNQDLKSGDEFANFVIVNAMLWHDKEQVPLEYPNEGYK